jgi:NADH-quinone oxidoreductase subunit F
VRVTDEKGNVKDGNFRAVQIGEPSNRCLAEKHLDLSLNFNSLKKLSLWLV